VSSRRYKVLWTDAARRWLEGLGDSRVQRQLLDRSEQLSLEPEKQGKPLTGELFGYRSLRAVGQRYRIIYEVRRGEVLVLIVAAGLRKEGSRKDIYALARKLIRSGLLGR